METVVETPKRALAGAVLVESALRLLAMGVAFIFFAGVSGDLAQAALFTFVGVAAYGAMNKLAVRREKQVVASVAAA